MLDPFFGCGTVGLVCRRLNRQFIGVELNPEDADEAMKLLEKQPINGTVSKRFRCKVEKDAHQPAFLETPAQKGSREISDHESLLQTD